MMQFSSVLCPLSHCRNLCEVGLHRVATLLNGIGTKQESADRGLGQTGEKGEQADAVRVSNSFLRMVLLAVIHCHTTE